MWSYPYPVPQKLLFSWQGWYRLVSNFETPGNCQHWQAMESVLIIYIGSVSKIVLPRLLCKRGKRLGGAFRLKKIYTLTSTLCHKAVNGGLMYIEILPIEAPTLILSPQRIYVGRGNVLSFLLHQFTSYTYVCGHRNFPSFFEGSSKLWFLKSSKQWMGINSFYFEEFINSQMCLFSFTFLLLYAREKFSGQFLPIFGT